MKVSDVRVGEEFEYLGLRYRLRFHNAHCVQANKVNKTCLTRVYKLIANDTEVTLLQGNMGRQDLVGT